MATFGYIARDAAGQKVAGTLSGASEQAVVAELQARQLSPVRVHPMRERRWRKRGLSARELAGAYRQLADLLKAGVPLLRALRVLGNSRANPRMGAMFTHVADAVADGARLGDAMAAQPRVFNAVQVAMIRAGERGGFLQTVLMRLSGFLEARADLRATVIGNMIYPMILLIVGCAVVVLSLVFFVPKFEKYYSGMDLGLATKILLGASALFTRHWGWLIVIVAGLALLAVITMRNERLWGYAGAAAGRLPWLGGLWRTLAVARFMRVMGTLLDNGVPLLGAMQISRDAAGHSKLEAAIDQAAAAVKAGESLAVPLRRSGLFAEDVVEMIAVGESANNLPDVLGTAASAMERRIERQMLLMVRLMEPLLLLLLAGMVAFIFLGLVLPMMQMSSRVT